MTQIMNCWNSARYYWVDYWVLNDNNIKTGENYSFQDTTEKNDDRKNTDKIESIQGSTGNVEDYPKTTVKAKKLRKNVIVTLFKLHTTDWTDDKYVQSNWHKRKKWIVFLGWKMQEKKWTNEYHNLETNK